MGCFLLGRQALKAYVCVRESSWNAMRVRAWAETLLYRSWLHGVTDVISGRSRVRTHMDQHDGHDGNDAVAHERVEEARIDACPLRGARERGQEDMWKLAGRVRLGAQGPVRRSVSRLPKCAQHTCHSHCSSAASEAMARARTSGVLNRKPCVFHVSAAKGRRRLARTTSSTRCE